VGHGCRVVSSRVDAEGAARIALADAFEKPVPANALLESHKGASAVADVGKSYFAGPRVHRTLSDLTDVCRKARRSPVVLAGDFNVSTQGERSVDNEASAVFARLRGWHLADALAHTSASRLRLKGCKCADGNACTHVQTVKSGAQLDYAFISTSLLPTLTACFVEQTKAASAFSDHHPVVLEWTDAAIRS
jgi:endonuclease/exonuclease/phosphatase family metal-dependent hydrolase